MSEILSKVRKLNWMLQESQTGALSYNDMCEILSDLLKANVYVTNTKDKVIGMSLKIQQDSIMIGETVTGQEWFSGDDNGGLLNIKKKSANICELGGY